MYDSAIDAGSQNIGGRFPPTRRYSAPVQVRLIVNPLASAVGDRIVDGVTARLAAVCDLEVVRTEYPGHARALAAAATDVAVALGGDGTFNEVVNGMPSGGVRAAPRRRVLRVCPPARVHRTTAQSGRELARAIAGHVRTVGLGQWTAAGSCSPRVGFDAEAIRAVDEARRGRPGYRRPGDLRVAEAGQGLARRRLRAAERMTVTAAGRPPARAAYLAVANQHPYTYFGRLPVRPCPAPASTRRSTRWQCTLGKRAFRG